MLANTFRSRYHLEYDLNKYKFLVSQIPYWLNFQFSLLNVTLVLVTRAKEKMNLTRSRLFLQSLEPSGAYAQTQCSSCGVKSLRLFCLLLAWITLLPTLTTLAKEWCLWPLSARTPIHCNSFAKRNACPSARKTQLAEVSLHFQALNAVSLSTNKKSTKMFKESASYKPMFPGTVFLF